MRQRPLGLFDFVSLVGLGWISAANGLELEASLKVVHKQLAKTLPEV